MGPKRLLKRHLKPRSHLPNSVHHPQAWQVWVHLWIQELLVCSVEAPEICENSNHLPCSAERSVADFGRFGVGIFPAHKEVPLRSQESQEFHMEGGFFTTHASQAGQGPCKMQDDAVCSQSDTIEIEQMQSCSPQ